ncbi:MAG TPA: serine/threonine-protein kinase [Ktedonobacteraceae bacterium]|nr:serine/threonine-protein kinase [Ktedonobacteraceae bacterium]
MTDTTLLDQGTTIGGHYVIDGLINRGGFGAVYRGIDLSEGKQLCAIKETYDVTPTARRRALMEAAVLFTINSKHLPRVYDAFEANGRFYLVMQLIEGKTLKQLLILRGKPCSVQEVEYWLIPIMHVLNELHSRNPAVIHRDIKPENIILTPDQTAVLVDFGLTKLYDPNSDTQTTVRAVSGGYSPVEQYVGKTSPQSDIYAMAATIYFLLTLQLPPESVNRSYRDGLISPCLLNPTLSPNLERVLLKAMSVDADQRYRSMNEFAQALQNPSFMPYADTTSIYGGSNAIYVYPQSATTQPQGIDRQSVPVPAPITTPAKQYVHPQPATQPVLPANPNPSHTKPAKPMPEYRPLPSSFNQGCLWGLAQGLLAAFIVLIMKKEVFFYVAIIEGFLFFLLAGFFTTRKGGKSLRAIWTGFWAGIVSTVTFWSVIAIGFAVLVSQNIARQTSNAQQNGSLQDAGKELQNAITAVGATFPFHPAIHQPGTNVVVFLIGGLLCAIGFSLVGGILGTSRFRAKMRKRGYI